MRQTVTQEPVIVHAAWGGEERVDEGRNSHSLG